MLIDIAQRADRALRSAPAPPRERHLCRSDGRRQKRRNAPDFHLTTSPTWWLWRGGCTRSHSELGRETPQRRWYFVLRRGRVGRCQVCKVVRTNTSGQSLRGSGSPLFNASTNGPRSHDRGPFCVVACRIADRSGADSVLTLRQAWSMMRTLYAHGDVHDQQTASPQARRQSFD